MSTDNIPTNLPVPYVPIEALRHYQETIRSEVSTERSRIATESFSVITLLHDNKPEEADAMLQSLLIRMKMLDCRLQVVGEISGLIGEHGVDLTDD